MLKGGEPLFDTLGSRLKLLKSTFNAENFIRRLSRSISSHFGAIHSKNVHHSPKLRKIHQNPHLEGSRSFKVIDVDTPKKLVTRACYHKQDVCAYLQLFSCEAYQYQ